MRASVKQYYFTFNCIVMGKCCCHHLNILNIQIKIKKKFEGGLDSMTFARTNTGELKQPFKAGLKEKSATAWFKRGRHIHFKPVNNE